MTKLLPLGMAGYFLFTRKWRALICTLAVFVAGLLALWLLEPQVFSYYLEANRQASWANIERLKNVSVFTQARYLLGGWRFVAVIFLYLAALVWRNRKALFTPLTQPDYSFFLYSFLAVMLLPICWSYSLVPLLPVFGYFVLRGQTIQKVIAGVCLLALIALPPFNAPKLTSMVILLGTALFWFQPPAERRSVLERHESEAPVEV